MPGGEEMRFPELEVKLEEPTLAFPTSPTTKQVYFLTNLDQNIAASMRSVYFFNTQEDKKHEDPASVLKEALGKLLVEFFLMAGRLGISPEGKLQVMYEDQGALFVEATANNCLADLGDVIPVRRLRARFTTTIV